MGLYSPSAPCAVVLQERAQDPPRARGAVWNGGRIRAPGRNDVPRLWDNARPAVAGAPPDDPLGLAHRPRLPDGRVPLRIQFPVVTQPLGSAVGWRRIPRASPPHIFGQLRVHLISLCVCDLIGPTSLRSITAYTVVDLTYIGS